MNKYIEILLITVLIAVTSFLRFWNLGYSEYSLDEPSSFLFYERKINENTIDYLLNQRKGPIQYFVSSIPYLITNDYTNELAQRIPFAIFNTASILIFYLVIKKITGNVFIALIASTLLSFNGFIVAFGRISQYQSLNLFFSFLSIYFFSKENNGKYNNIILGSIFFCISFLAHWDAIYSIPLVIYFLYRNKISKKQIYSIILTSMIILFPFMVPYSIKLVQNASNQKYFKERMSIGHMTDLKRDIDRVILYNPFLLVETFFIFGLFGILCDLVSVFYKKIAGSNGAVTMWFSFMIFVYLFVMKYPGTHIYNVLLPLIILTSIGLFNFILLYPKFFKVLPTALVFSILFFLFFQSYIVFIDHKKEYPWDVENILGFYTPIYTQKDVVIQKNLLGFPLNRGWKKINEFLLTSPSLTYATNDIEQISNVYMEYDKSNGKLPYYYIAIKKPYNFVKDYKASNIKNKNTIKEIFVNNKNTAIIYLVKNNENTN